MLPDELPVELEGELGEVDGEPVELDVDGLLLMPLPLEVSEPAANVALPKANSAAETAAANSFIFIVFPLIGSSGKDCAPEGSNGRAAATAGPHIAATAGERRFP